MAGETDGLEIDAAQAERLLGGSPAARLLDVREPDERAAGYLADSAHIPLGELPQRVGELARDAPLIIYCRSGVRSLMAAQALSGAGFEAYSLAGGLVAWAAEGRKLEPDGGIVAEMEVGAQ